MKLIEIQIPFPNEYLINGKETSQIGESHSLKQSISIGYSAQLLNRPDAGHCLH